MKTTRIQRERERGKKAWFVSCVCVCVCAEMWDDRQKEIQKKYEEGGKTLLSFWCFETPHKGVALQKLNGHKKEEEIRISKYEST